MEFIGRRLCTLVLFIRGTAHHVAKEVELQWNYSLLISRVTIIIIDTYDGQVIAINYL